MEALTLDVDGDVQSIAPYTEGKLLMIVNNYDADPVTTTLCLYDIENEEAAELGALPTQDYSTPSGISYDEARGKLYYVLSGSVWRMDVTEDGLGEPEEFGDMPLGYASGNGVVYGDLYVLANYDAVIGRDVTLDQAPPSACAWQTAAMKTPSARPITVSLTSIRNTWSPSLLRSTRITCCKA